MEQLNITATYLLDRRWHKYKKNIEHVNINDRNSNHEASKKGNIELFDKTEQISEHTSVKPESIDL